MSFKEWRAAMLEQGVLPVADLLNDCVFYPACGLDGDPVKYLHRQYQSFVYVDYAIERKQLLNHLNGFTGYHVVNSREIKQGELVPQGWNPPPLRAADGRLERARILPQEPFAVWALYERLPEYNEEHGPPGFSLLFICADGAATYHALFYTHQVVPAVIAIIQPGTGFGGNWTDFEDPDQVLGRLVLEHPRGIPQFMLYGGWGDGEWYRQAPWPEYDTPGTELHGRLWLFRRARQ